MNATIMNRSAPIKPEDIPADLVAEMQAESGLDEARVREIAAWEIAARRTGFWERLEDTSALPLEERVRRMITPPATTPLPVWSDDVLDELRVGEADRARGEALLRRLMALVGRDESAVRAFLAETPAGFDEPLMQAVQERGLGELDQLLRDIVVGGMA